MKKEELKKLIKEMIQKRKHPLDDLVKKLSFYELVSIINHFQDDFTVSENDIADELKWITKNNI